MQYNVSDRPGLYYYGARYYDPKVSKWMGADPAGFELVSPMDQEGKPRSGYSVVEATNWYSYTSNNPVKYLDPTGLTQEEGAGGGGPINTDPIPEYTAVVIRNQSSWDSTFNEGWSHENVGDDFMIVNHTPTGSTHIVPIQSVANHAYKGEDTNTVVGEFDLVAGNSDSFAGPELVITNARTVHGASIGPDGRGTDTDGSNMGADRWLVHSPRRAGHAADDSAPFSAGCFIPTSHENHMGLINFLGSKGFGPGKAIRGRVIEQ